MIDCLLGVFTYNRHSLNRKYSASQLLPIINYVVYTHWRLIEWFFGGRA